jgi:hypothetical protein
MVGGKSCDVGRAPEFMLVEGRSEDPDEVSVPPGIRLILIACCSWPGHPFRKGLLREVNSGRNS